MGVSEPAASSQGTEGAAERKERKERVDAVRRLQSRAAGSLALQRLTDLAAQLLRADTAQISLLTDVQTAIIGTGLPPAESAASSR